MTRKRSKKPTHGLQFVDRTGIKFYWSSELKEYVTVPEDYNVPMPPVIGVITWYLGKEKRYGGYGAKHLITGIFRYDEPEDSPDRRVVENARLAQLGGVRRQDGAEVRIWDPELGKWGFVGQEITDITVLEHFRHLGKLDPKLKP